MNEVFQRPRDQSAGLMTFVLFAWLLVGSSPAHAQWAWKEATGTTVYSDRAPPPDIKPEQILRRPGRVDGVETANPSAESVAPASQAKSIATLNAESKKRKLEAAEAEKKNAQSQKQTEQLAQQCERLRQGLVPLQNGSRMRSADGGVMDDAQRNAEVARINGLLVENCK